MRLMKARVLSFAAIGLLAAMLVPSFPVPLRPVSDLFVKTADLSFVAHAGGDNQKDGEVLCRVRSGVDANQVAQRYNMQVKKDLKSNGYVFSLPRSVTVDRAVMQLQRDVQVASAEPNYIVGIPEVRQRSVAFVDGRATATQYYFQYPLQRIHSREVQGMAMGTDGTGVTVAIIDTGLDATHTVFTHVTPGWDYVDGDSNPAEAMGGQAYGHGTMVAGIVVAVAPGATIMPVRAFGPDGFGSASDVAAAIRFAATHGADVINMSFGLTGTCAEIASAIVYAWGRGVVLIASAGNGNSGIAEFPANDSTHVISVGATDSADLKASFSNYGQVDVLAPGVDVGSVYPGGQFAVGGGTSHAAAFVSGEAALIISAGANDVYWTILHTATNIDNLNPGYRRALGYGRIDALAAIWGRR